MRFNKEFLIDSIICVVMVFVIIAEIFYGFNTLSKKWLRDTDSLIEQATAIGRGVTIDSPVFTWPETQYPDEEGDTIQIDNNKFRINGHQTDAPKDQEIIRYSSLEDSSARILHYEKVLDKAKLVLFHTALATYFEGNEAELCNLLPINWTPENIECYQQTFTDGFIPILFDQGSQEYYMFLDCSSSYYVINCTDPVVVTDGKVTVHYASASADPLVHHSWSTYEAGAIDNTRAKLLKQDIVDYTNTGTLETNPNTGVGAIGSSGGYTSESQNPSTSSMYMTDADDRAREVLVSYADKEFDTNGVAKDGSTQIDITSTSAKASEWVLTQTSYSYTDYGITINNLSGKRNSNLFEINGNASNTIGSERPWVLVVKFMGEDNELLGVRVLDNRTDPLPADGVNNFTVSLTKDDNIDFTQIVAIQFAMH